MTKRTVKVTFTGSFTYDIDDTSDDFEMYYGAKFVDDVDIETVRSEDGNLDYLIESVLEKRKTIQFELDWDDLVAAEEDIRNGNTVSMEEVFKNNEID